MKNNYDKLESSLKKQDIGPFLVIVLFFLLCQTGIAASQQTVTGTVMDESGMPLPGVTIRIEGTSRGVNTNMDGGFSIDATPDDVLLISFIGFNTQEVPVSDETNFEITMTEKVGMLNEVVVVGYGTQKRKDLTGSISTISSEQIEQRPVASFDEALQGLAPGIEIAPRNARPGEVGAIKIRGIGSISAGFAPLFVVDGFPTDAAYANSINPADIKSIDILKDASSTAIYGSRGANGVIIITTKEGKKGEDVFNIGINSGVALVNKSDFYDVLDADEYLQWYREKAINNGTEIPDWITNWDGTDTDWQNLIYRIAQYQNYSISMSGGSEKAKYYFSGNYIKQEDILPNQGFQKISVRAKIDYQVTDKFKVGINVAPNFTIQEISAPDQDHASLTGASIFLPPVIPARNEDGTPSNPNDYGILTVPLANPLEISEKYNDKIKTNYILANAYAELDLTEGLTAKATFGANITDTRTKLYASEMRGLGLPAATTLNLNANREVSLLSENTINYKKDFEDAHSINLLAGFTAQKTKYENINANANTFPSELGQTIGFGDTQSTSSAQTSNSLLSLLARLNYNYKDKYLLTATARRDGSSRFGENRRWGFFPSIALGWNFSNEDFIKDNLDFVDLAKFRISHGVTGSNSIGDFTSRASLNSVNHSFGGSDILGFINGDPGNPDLSWEVSRQTDLGLDLSFYNRVDLTFDYYYNETEDLLLFVNVPPTTGYTGNLTNIGKMRNSGFELAINSTLIEKDDFTWNFGFNISNTKQEVLALGSDQSRLFQFFGVLVTEIGGPLEQARGLQQTGILTQEDIENGVPHRPGDIAGDYKYLDVNDDGVIDSFNQADGVLLGDNNPNWIYGINTRLKYKNWQLSALLNGQAGGEVLDFVYQIMSLHSYNTNMGQYFYEGRYISEERPGNGSVPRAGYSDEGAVSSWEMQSTDFLRIRNINLSYNFPKFMCDRLSVNKFRASLSIENLYTFTSFEGGNPSATRYGSGRSVGDGRTLSLNSVPTAPLPRIITLGINFSL